MLTPVLNKGDKVKFNPDSEINVDYPHGHSYEKVFEVHEVKDGFCVTLVGLDTENDYFQFERFIKL